MESLLEVDLYELIGVANTASSQEIKKAYRKKALSCHPDKNPNNPRAAELFHELSRALEILTDASARAAYDKVINAKHQARERIKEFDSKRRKLKEDLEARENAYRLSTSTSDIKNDTDRLQAEIERLHKEGSKQLEEEITLMKKHLEKRSSVFYAESESSNGSYKIKVTWKLDKNCSDNDDYNYDTLHRIFSKYGEINALVISTTKKGGALVEYNRKSDAETALNTELGLAHNPLKLRKLWHEQEDANSFTKRNVCGISDLSKDHINQRLSDIEFERTVLSNLRKAEERKRSLAKLRTEKSN